MANEQDNKELLAQLTVPELKELADKHDVDLGDATKKGEIINVLDEKLDDETIASETPDLDEDEDDTANDEVDVDGEEAAYHQQGTDKAPPGGERTPTQTHAMTSLKPRANEDPVEANAAFMGDARKMAAERVKGKTSDAATRKEGVKVGDVGTDPSEGPKASDGAEYDFPPQGDVDVATIDQAYYEGEFPPVLNLESWVRLGNHESVPDRFRGHIAAVVDAPTFLCNCDWSPNTHEHPSPNSLVTVKLRDETGATLRLPYEAFDEVSTAGRSGLLPIA